MSTFDTHMTQRSALQDLAFFVGKWQATGEPRETRKEHTDDHKQTSLVIRHQP